MKRVLFTLAAALGLLATATDARPVRLLAQAAYPNRPITMIVPAAAGGPSDTVARLVAETMSADLGQRVVIENMGGAGGSLGAGRVAKSAPDGYTLLLYHIGVATFGALYPDLPYKPAEAFDSVGLVTEVPLTIVSRKDLPAVGRGGIAGLAEGQGRQCDLRHRRRRRGLGPLRSPSDRCHRRETDGGSLQGHRTGHERSRRRPDRHHVRPDDQHHQPDRGQGQIKPYAVTTRERIKILPNVPTLAESGVKGFDLSAWHAIWAPKGTPEPIRQKLAASLQQGARRSEGHRAVCRARHRARVRRYGDA